MTTQTFKVFGYSFALSVPATVEEFDQNAKKAGAARAEAIKNVYYRSTDPDVRDGRLSA